MTFHRGIYNVKRNEPIIYIYIYILLSGNKATLNVTANYFIIFKFVHAELVCGNIKYVTDLDIWNKHFLSFLDPEVSGVVNNFLRGKQGSLCLDSQYHGCWWPGATMSQGTRSHDIDLVLPELWWRHQMETFSALLVLCVRNSPVTREFPAQGQWGGALMFSLICVWINDWVNNREAGDLRRHRAHYDVIVMILVSAQERLI